MENNKYESLGKIFGLFVAEIINACIIEESKIIVSSNIGSINYNNISNSAKLLSDNINNLNDVELPFTKWISSCPLLYPFCYFDNFPIIRNYIISCCGGDILSESLFRKDTSMMNLLDGIAIRNKKKKTKFSASKDNIAKTTKLINESNLDLEKIVNGSEDDAKSELLNIFESISPNSLKRFRERAELSNGILEILPVSEELF